jgi:hypothetical protein
MGFLDKIKEGMARINLTYIGGHPEIDKAYLVSVGREGDNLSIFRGARILASIPVSSIKSTRLERADNRSLGKGALGAVAGGVLLGPLGLVAGGALGGRKKDASVIVVTIEYGKSEIEVLFAGANKNDDIKRKYPRFANLLK